MENGTVLFILLSAAAAILRIVNITFIVFAFNGRTAGEGIREEKKDICAQTIV